MRYEAPTTTKEAATLLAGEKGETFVLAGGTDLLVRMKTGLSDPDLVVDIKHIPAMQEIKTITANEAYEILEVYNCNIIDIREINELDNTGRVEGANHIPRGMLEVYLDPNSPIIQNGQVDKNKELILFCAGGVRSALAAKSLKEMGVREDQFHLISQMAIKDPTASGNPKKMTLDNTLNLLQSCY